MVYGLYWYALFLRVNKKSPVEANPQGFFSMPILRISLLSSDFLIILSELDRIILKGELL